MVEGTIGVDAGYWRCSEFDSLAERVPPSNECFIFDFVPSRIALDLHIQWCVQVYNEMGSRDFFVFSRLLGRKAPSQSVGRLGHPLS